MVPLRDDAGFSTAASIANTTDASMTVTLTVRNGAGSQIYAGTVGFDAKQIALLGFVARRFRLEYLTVRV